MDGVRKGPDLRWWWNDKPIEDGLVAGAYTFRLGRPVFDWMEDSRPKEMPIGEPPFPYSEASAAKGERVYRELQCASCHGLEGRGDGPSAATTRGNLGEVVLPADYTKGFKGGSDPKDIVRTFMTGLHGTPMPSFARNFATPEAPWHLAHYVLRQARAR
jgi:cytochrome c oxidase cbb3-type subunit 2